MTSNIDIYRTASVLIREHGEDAALEAGLMSLARIVAGQTRGLRQRLGDRLFNFVVGESGLPQDDARA